MYIDIVFPSNNEEKFIKNAILLGYNGLILTYKFNKKNVELFHKVKKILQIKKNFLWR